MKNPVLHPTFSYDDKHGIRPFDQANGSVDPWTGVGGLAGFAGFSFFFFNEGGTGNLAPGRPTTQTAQFTSPPGSGALITLRSVSGAFVTDGGAHLTERPLGQFVTNVFFSGPNTLACQIRLSDSNSDDPIQVWVNGTLLFFN
ncbi:hypothetical protein ABIB82_006757 [Bradyrhizobium sp. i1.8.4]|uniref:hypothetical protein n=1 Tax=unclassified Bradyrhizobium TaxID=2631580 RepID=UPI003D25E5C1